jgi:hypothetical protein
MYNARRDQDEINKQRMSGVRDPESHTCLCGKPKHIGQAFCPECIEKYKTQGC